MENAPINTKNIYVLFDYKTRIVYSVEGFKKKDFYGRDVLPANTREKNIFLEHFYLKGRRKVKFRDYKVFDPSFHGTAKYKKIYDTISLNCSQYIKFLELMSIADNECENLSQALNLLFYRAESLYYEYQLSRDVEKLTKEAMKVVFETINEKMREL